MSRGQSASQHSYSNIGIGGHAKAVVGNVYGDVNYNAVDPKGTLCPGGSLVSIKDRAS
jgi:hypothetical protein